MKAVVILVSFFLFRLVASAQSMMVQTQSEWTVAGIQHGISVGYETKSSWGLGVYYQAELEKEHEDNITRDDFRGLYLQAPVVKADRLSFFALVRAGFVNNHFVAIAPGLETRVHITRRLGTAFGMGLRMGYASVSGRLFVKMF
ncbi:MAG: hypothetical protein LOY03_12330 [Cyclobacteriaceae bacterium]|nr:hypothetical protein [Cyclobacteriaceae bacterium]